ncbi:hypothetical protein LXA43DRAFT_1067986 [Ganoderma leucocontextum]|nr:hypothetical protein LXA43DRAFT_1067986 [Ganoderma leucocontextum]
MVTENYCRDFDATAAALGRTLRLDEQGRVIPIGVADDPSILPEKAGFYVVWVGRAVGLFANWGLASTMVNPVVTIVDVLWHHLSSQLSTLSLGERHSPICRSASSRGYALIPAPVNCSPGSGAASVNPDVLTRNRITQRKKGDAVFAVIRGERPGVYLDCDTALRAGGCSPTMKIVCFNSLKYACFYFVVEYMGGNVGVPEFVVVFPVDEDY